jgi:hypothetical protein
MRPVEKAILKHIVARGALEPVMGTHLLRSRIGDGMDWYELRLRLSRDAAFSIWLEHDAVDAADSDSDAMAAVLHQIDTAVAAAEDRMAASMARVVGGSR